MTSLEPRFVVESNLSRSRRLGGLDKKNEFDL